MLFALLGVRVPAADRNIEDAGAELGPDHPRHQATAALELPFLLVANVAEEAIVLARVAHDLFQAVDRRVRLQRRALHEGQ